MFKKSVKLSLGALLVGSGILSTTAVLVVSGSPALAKSKGVTCPDNTTGVTEGSWSIVCTGQTAVGATVTITSVKTTSVSFEASSPTDSFTGVSNFLGAPGSGASGGTTFTFQTDDRGPFTLSFGNTGGTVAGAGGGFNKSHNYIGKVTLIK